MKKYDQMATLQHAQLPNMQSVKISTYRLSKWNQPAQLICAFVVRIYAKSVSSYVETNVLNNYDLHYNFVSVYVYLPVLPVAVGIKFKITSLSARGCPLFLFFSDPLLIFTLLTCI